MFAACCWLGWLPPDQHGEDERARQYEIHSVCGDV